ncbi:MAG TPA: GAF domain-containing protein, partial [Thermoanaerobaculia bacterium]|nr:GAF domain-containing protein [Thermoanaerobaculia bacterium]
MNSGANGERRRTKAADGAKRRLKTLRALGEHMAENAAEACAAAAAVLGQNDDDLPFALVYLLDRDGGRARLAGRAGMPAGTAACPSEVDLGGPEAWPFSAVLAAGAAQLVEDLAERFGPLPGGPWPEPTALAMVLPLARAGEGRLWGFVILGVSPRLAFDDEYRDFFHLIARQVATAIANARAFRRDLAALNRQLHERAAELETLLNVIPVGIGVALDPACSRIQVNPAFAGVLGLSSGDNASKTAPSGERPRGFRVVGDDGREIPDDQLPMQVAAREGREIRGIEFDIVHADGRVVRLLEYAAPLFDEAGQPRGCVGAFVDITDRRRVEARDRFLVALDDAIRPLTAADAIMAACTELLGKHLAVDRCTYAEVHADLDTIDLPFNYVNDVPSMVGRYRLADFGDEVV